MKEPMVRVQIIGLKDKLQPTVKALHELGCLHIEDMAATSAPAARPFAPDPLLTTQRETRARLLAQIEGQFAALVDVSFKPEETPEAGHDCLDAAQAGARLLAPQLQDLANQEEALASESATIPRYIATLRQLLPIIPEAAEKPGHIFTAVLVGRNFAWVLVELEQALLEQSAGRADLAQTVLTGDRHALVVVLPKRDAHLLEKLLNRDDIARLQVPENIQHLSPQSALAVLQEREQAIPAARAGLQKARSALAPLWLPRLDAWRRCLRTRLDELEILNLFGETNDTFTVIGWLPQADLPRLSQRLQAQVGGGLFIEPVPLTAGAPEQAPVLLRNPAPARPFQSLVKLLSLPSYDGLDPTILMAVGLPILFGIILGDIGYGALLLLLTLYGRRRFPAGTARDLMHVLMLGAGWSIVFGFLYGEMFGTLGEHFGLHAIWFDRADPEALFALFIFSLAAGVTHITLGLLIGIWDAWRARHRHHLLERGGMFIGLIGLFIIVAVLADFLPAGAMNPGVAVLIIGIALLSSAMGWLGLLIGPIEFIGLIGNILSYLRLAAVGLASVYVARLANDLVGSIGSLIIGIIIAVLIHALNLVLGAFSPTIHSLRLHYVEFFRKFYEGGGEPYAPFQIGD